MPSSDIGTSTPADAVVERLNDPTVAASLVTLLDHAELLSTLVLGLGGFLERGDHVMAALAEGLSDLKTANQQGAFGDLPKLADVQAATKTLVAGAPALDNVLGSALVTPESIALVSMFAEAAGEGMAAARRNGTRIDGVRGALKLLKDPEVQRGLGMFAEIARALGRRAGTA